MGGERSEARMEPSATRISPPAAGCALDCASLQRAGPNDPCCFAGMRLILAQVHSFPTGARTEKRRPRRPANMDFHFIDFAPRRSEYGSNHCQAMETKMSFRLPL